MNKRRNELLSELADFQQTKKFIDEAQKTITELNEEKDSHSEMIQQINLVFLYHFNFNWFPSIEKKIISIFVTNFCVVACTPEVSKTATH